ncbi:MAG: tetratricopeptide repeat protein [Bacteroidota bacterium]
MAKVKPTKKGSTNKKPRFLYATSWHPWIIFLLGFGLYANTLGHDYTQDDAIVIYDNEFTMRGFDGMADILAYDTFRGFFKEEGKEKLVSGGRYRPFTLLMFATGVEFFSPEQHKIVGHLVNAILYGLTGLLLYFLVRQLTKPKFRESKSLWLALVTSVLFVVHPLHTEVVANIKGRDEIMALLCSLGAAYMVLQYWDRKNAFWLFGASVVFFIGLLSKENTITFLAVIPFMGYFFRDLNWKQQGKALLQLLVATAMFLALRSSILGVGLGEPSMELMNNPFLKWTGSQYVEFTVLEKYATILYTLGQYLFLHLIPHPLTHDYYPRHVEMMTFGDWQVLLSGLVYLAMGIYAILGIRKKDPIAFGFIYYLATLSIVSNIVFPIGTNMSERFVYMPSVGLCFAAAFGLYYLLGVPKKKPIHKAARYQLVLILLSLVIVLFGAKTVLRNVAWKDNFTLFTTDVAVSVNSAKLQNSVGGELITQAVKEERSESERQQMLQEAVVHLQKAVEIHLFYKNAYLLLGNANNYLKNYEASVQYYEEALRLDPNYSDAFRNKGLTLRDAGKFYGEEKGDLARSIDFLRKADAAMPGDFETLRLLGVAHGISGQAAEAIRYFEQAAALQPENPDALFNLGTAYQNAGQTEKAAEYHQRALSIDPDYLKNRGIGN